MLLNPKWLVSFKIIYTSQRRYSKSPWCFILLFCSNAIGRIEDVSTNRRTCTILCNKLRLLNRAICHGLFWVGILWLVKMLNDCLSLWFCNILYMTYELLPNITNTCTCMFKIKNLMKYEIAGISLVLFFFKISSQASKILFYIHTYLKITRNLVLLLIATNFGSGTVG